MRISLSACAALLASSASFAGPIVLSPANSDVSAPLSTLAGKTHASSQGRQPNAAQPTGPLRQSGKTDSVASISRGPLSDVVSGISFAGQSADDNRSLLGGVAYVPPDTNGAAGETQYVQTVNVTLAVYDKATGNVLLGPILLTDLWAGFGGLCETVQGGDPVVLYDQIARRWIVSELAYNANLTENHQCIAVSTTADATGHWARYDYPFGTTLNDYPKFGVWPDAYYYTANMYAGGRTFAGALACAFDRGAMLHGKAANAICFQNPSSISSLLPANVDGATLPPAGEPGLFVGLADASDLNFYTLHADFKTPANSTFGGTTIPVAPFNEICARATSLACIPEPSPGENVDGLGDRLMFRLAYRNFGDHESLVATHTVAGGPLAALRWYEIRNPSAPYVAQQGTLYDPAVNYWLGSAAMDKAGDLALGFSASSNNVFPSIEVLGRTPTDTPGTLRGPLVLKAGTGVQLNNSYRRWGDYSSMAIDPVDDCTFWYTNEYYATSGTINWATQISSFRFAGCR